MKQQSDIEMNQKYLEKKIRSVAGITQDHSGVFSLFFDLCSHLGREVLLLKAWANEVRVGIDDLEKKEFDAAIDSAHSFLERNFNMAKSGALYIKLGANPHVEEVLFDVPVESQHYYKTYPVIYPLVELRDKFERFILVATSSQKAHIAEIDLGRTSLEIVSMREDENMRTGREWTREHYSNVAKERGKKFLKEKVDILRKITAQKGKSSIIIAGEPRYVNRLKEAMPKDLQALVVDEVRSGFSDNSLKDIIEKAQEAFLQVEKTISLSAVDELVRTMHGSGLVAIGVDECYKGLIWGNVQNLVISKNMPSEDSEKLLKVASVRKIPIETVEDSEKLEALGGVGAILRYRTPSEEMLNVKKAI